MNRPGVRAALIDAAIVGLVIGACSAIIGIFVRMAG
jgi:hypothetical protein